MRDHEPASGYNLPPGCFDDDIDALYATPKRCETCLHGIHGDFTSENERLCELMDDYVPEDHVCGFWKEW